MTLGQALYSFTDFLAHKMPRQIVRLFALPALYTINVWDLFAYESARIMYTAFVYCMSNKIKGDYAEFGVFKGKTTIEAYKIANRVTPGIHFHLFDSFEGLPESEGVFHTGQFACTRPQFERNLKRAGVDLSRFTITEGYFNETLPTIETVYPIAVALIDCDLYSSTVPVLEFLTPRLVDGAVLIFDDWYCRDGKGGEQKACQEWLEKNPHITLTEYQNFHWAGKSFIVTKG